MRLGQTERVEAALAEMNDQQRDPAFMRAVTAALRLASDDPQAAIVALGPAVAGSVPPGTPILQVEALLLEAVARGALGDPAAAQRALELALDLAEPDRLIMPSSSIRRRNCLSARPGTAPRTPPSSQIS